MASPPNSPLDPSTGTPVKPQEGDIIKSLKSRPLDAEEAKKSTRPPTFIEGVKSIKVEDFSSLAQAPCARQGLLYGLTAGGIAGGLRWAFRGTPMQAANWAVGLWFLGSAISHQQCQYQRQTEKKELKRHVEIITSKKADEKKLEEAREAHRRLEEEHMALRARERKWWKPW